MSWLDREVPIVLPLSRAKIEVLARDLSQKYAPETFQGKPFPILTFVDEFLPDDFGIEFGVENLGPGKEGRFVDDCLEVDESVYLRACRDDGRARFTLAHETGHVVLHRKQLNLINDSYRGREILQRRRHLKPFLDPEWQANTFASSLLMPIEAIRHLARKHRTTSLAQLIAAVKSAMLVSTQAAETRVGKLMECGAILLEN